MEPYLRPGPPEGQPSEPCPAGCVAEPAGTWEGQPQEIVYDPRRHQITLLHGRPSAAFEAALTETGWEPQAVEGEHQWWVRDRLAEARRQLARADGLDISSLDRSIA